VAAARRQFNLTPAKIENWVEDGKRGIENALRAKPEDVREQYERQLKDLQEAYGEAVLEIRARKKLSSLLERTRADALGPAGPEGRRHIGCNDQAVPMVWCGASHDVRQANQAASQSGAGAGRANQENDRG